MKVNILRADLTQALTGASHFVAARAQLPILGNVLLRASEAKLTIQSTNLEVSFTTSIGAQVIEDGEISVPSRIIAELIATLPDEKIEISVEKEKLLISSVGFKSEISGMNTSDFPPIIANMGDVYAAIDLQELSKSLTKVLFASSRDETRPELSGVLCVVSEGQLTFVSSDGFRLSQKSVKFTGGLKTGEVIIPKFILSEILKLGKEGEVKFEIKEAEHLVVFSLGKSIISSRTIASAFPDFKKIIPQKFSTVATLSAKELSAGIKSASIFAREEANVVNLNFSPEGLLITTKSAKVGSQSTRIDATVEGPALDISFNYRFIEEFIGVAGSETIKIQMNSTSSPSIWEDASDSDFLHLIMPVKVKE